MEGDHQSLLDSNLLSRWPACYPLASFYVTCTVHGCPHAPTVLPSCLHACMRLLCYPHGCLHTPTVLLSCRLPLNLALLLGVDGVQERVEGDYLSRLTALLTGVRGVNRTDAHTLGTAFGSLGAMMRCKWVAWVVGLGACAPQLRGTGMPRGTGRHG